VERSTLKALVADPVPFLSHEDPDVRRLAISACARNAADLIEPLGRRLSDDASAAVRAEAAEALGRAGPGAIPWLDAARNDADAMVVEAVTTAYGEVGDSVAVAWLMAQAEEGDDRLVREAAVASLGAIGDERALPTLLALAAAAPPQVRRRAVVALTAYDGPEVEAALRDASTDRNPMVREVAALVVGRPERSPGP
jgi:HEAT repeat protein